MSLLKFFGAAAAQINPVAAWQSKKRSQELALDDDGNFGRADVNSAKFSFSF